VPHLGGECAEIADRRFVQRGLAGDQGDGNALIRRILPQPIQEPDAVDEGHPEIEKDRVRPLFFDVGEGILGAGCQVHRVAFLRQHPRIGRAQCFIVVDDEDAVGTLHRDTYRLLPGGTEGCARRGPLRSKDARRHQPRAQ
jgi:hypothetical protein